MTRQTGKNTPKTRVKIHRLLDLQVIFGVVVEAVESKKRPFLTRSIS